MFCHVLTSVTTIQHSIHLHAQDLWHTNRQPTIRTTQSLSPNQFFIYRKILSHFIFLTSTLKVVFPLFFLTRQVCLQELAYCHQYKNLCLSLYFSDINIDTCLFLCFSWPGKFVYKNLAIDLFKNRRQDWEDLQGKTNKKRELFADIIDDDEPAGGFIIFLRHWALFLIFQNKCKHKTDLVTINRELLIV